ncbi:fructose-1,6-bisphosphatase [Ruminococcus sp.]|uniref:fructose-1,6-bisphosphatase n=1 Tax=Ruminococcus sp. TaxID=41978 RepID=UPI0025DA93F0|nr:fructose-1,6-bisphosphatase [Ruminococcus sp.]MCI6616549.1 fructose-1,6-bisphosphatase [Ruminococcus sp.]
MNKDKKRFLECLSMQYPTIDNAATEIINLQSILNLPKGTEHFLSDIHGEYKAFSHVLRNGSGAVMKKINDVFGDTLTSSEKKELASLIYYPIEKLEYIKSESLNTYDWYRTTLYRLVSVCRTVSSKYTRSKIRKALPDSFNYVIEELITEKKEVLNKTAYYEEIINTIIEIGYADKFIEEMSNLIQRLVIDHLHIIGDIYDRGSGSHFVMERLCNYHSLDIQWGNHDVLWMGASAGQTACIANIVRTSLLYDNVSVLENGYGISILPLMLFAMKTYGNDPCTQFKIRSKNSDASEIGLEMKAHKAISIIQFKLEGQLISEHPEYKMENRKLLHRIDFANKTIELDGKKYNLIDGNFPTINPDCPYELTDDEKEVVRKLRYAFVSCEKLKKHINLLLNKGSLYKVTNNNLLFHGCIPMTSGGEFRKTEILGYPLCGKALYDSLESCARKAFLSVNEIERKNGRDILWYLWNGADSPLYGRDKMTTFERYFIGEDSTHIETKDIYYTLIDSKESAEKIFDEFSVKGENRHIINGHVPIHHQEGENPVKCGGRVIIIDGGFSHPYHKVTGIAGYTLIYNSYGLMLTAHEPFRSVGEAIKDCTDMQTHRVASEVADRRILVGDTDNGAKIKESISDLKELINAYRSGEVRQNKHR